MTRVPATGLPVPGAALVVLVLLWGASPARGQTPSDSARVTARVTAPDSQPLAGAIVRSGALGAQTDSTGHATLSLPAGAHRLIVARLGFVPDTLAVTLRSGADTTLAFTLEPLTEELEGVVVSATRSGRRIDDEPLRVEVLGPEEVEEKLLMTPGDITMMLNETGGLRVQTTSPSLGGANVRVQGLRGRYTQILADGLPLYGGQTGGLGLLQIPPMDLGGVEIIKGAASALYGGSALGGVINLVSRRPGAQPVREVMVNQTTLGGTDVVAFLAGREPEEQGLAWTFLGGTHLQQRVDRDHDGWTDLPGYDRVVLRPRAFWRSARGHTAIVTAGFTGEEREGGTVGGATAPDGIPWPERLRTRRYDAGTVARLLAGAGVVTLRGSASLQHHRHTFGRTVERDEHLTWFGEAAWAARLGSNDLVLGAALQQERYHARDVTGFDHTFTVPALFAQTTVEPAPWLALSASGRIDRHSEYGTIASPRLSLLVRTGAVWTVRASAGGGYFAPTPFTEETEVTGLTPLLPLSGIDAERARGASLDIGGAVGPIEVNGTLFTSVVRHPVAVRDASHDAGAIELVNLPRPTRTRGGELLARWEREPVHITATYTYVDASELDPETLVRRRATLTPRHQAGVVTALEWEDLARVGLEVYYTGAQTLHDDAFRTRSPSYVHVGVLVERRIGSARVFVNGENLLDVRQTEYDPLVRPSPGLGGRWTNDVWGPLEGRVANVGVRFDFP